MATSSRQLSGTRMLVTGTPGQRGVLARELSAAGAEVHEAPLIAFEAAGDGRLAGRRLRQLGTYHYLVLTSATAVRALAHAAEEAGVPLSRGKARAPVVIAVGPATAAAARDVGLSPSGLPSRFTAAAVAEGLAAGGVAGKRVLIPRAEVAGEALPRRLRRAGARVDVLPLYRTIADPDAPPTVRRLLRSGLDMVTFSSGSAVRSFAAVMGSKRPAGLRVACIGPATAAVAREVGLEPDVVAERHTAEGLASAVLAYLGSARVRGAG